MAGGAGRMATGMARVEGAAVGMDGAGKLRGVEDVSAHSSEDSGVVSEGDSQERYQFYTDLHRFMASIGSPIQRLPTLGFKELDLWVLYREVTSRRGIDAVIAKKQWKEVADALNLPASCTDSGFRLRLHYVKYLEPYERAHFQPPREFSPPPSSRPQTTTGSLVTGFTRRTGSSSSLTNTTPVTPPGVSPHSYQPHASRVVGGATSSAGVKRKLKQKASQQKAEMGAGQGAFVADTHGSTSSTHRQDVTRVAGSAIWTDSASCGAAQMSTVGHVNFSRLGSDALVKYLQHYRLSTHAPNASKEELAARVSAHFVQTPVCDDYEVVQDFIKAARRRLC
ncbi:AT-rich interactive domain-containing protein 3A [Porphyridium purpureum]|uniref:AT-rich interactive domain-containing protein 3A n=1 Tax=Porphyridium purpureum TaxID=35688 RepID=A0A5J4YT02_PORPP|nr:AT-rich interactive domain-containing protein 3A [Porphyridium purpureum]|eukprot:POR2592..scf229_5